MNDMIPPQESLDMDALYAAYGRAIYLFFQQHVGNPQDAEDLTATTFSKALSSLSRYREQGRLTAWIFSIARHTLQDAQRRQRPQVDLALVAPALADPAALLLRFFGELDIGEIAARMGRSAGAIKMLIQRALARLRDQYRQAEQAMSLMVLACGVYPQLQLAIQPAVLRLR
jgi:DNA-directed RNA polymerase specialized sigma24 family protein